MILFTLENFGKNKAFPPEILQNCVTPTGISMAKTKIVRNYTWFFSSSPLYSFLTNL